MSSIAYFLHHHFLFPGSEVLSHLSIIYRRGGRGRTFEGLTMNVEFCEDNLGSSKKMRYLRNNRGGGGGVPRGPFPGSATDCSLSRFCVSLLVVGQHEKWNISANNGKRKMARGSNNAQNSLQLYRLS